MGWLSTTPTKKGHLSAIRPPFRKVKLGNWHLSRGRRQTMKVLKLVLILAVLAGLSGCIFVPWGGRGGEDHDRGGGNGEHHEEHR